MPAYEIVHIDGFLQANVAGELDFDATAAILRRVASDNEAQGRHLLLNLRGAEASGLSYSDVYRLVGMLSEHPAAFRGRLALLDTFREGFEKLQFFEASATEQGFAVRAFLDEAVAVAWLEAAL